MVVLENFNGRNSGLSNLVLLFLHAGRDRRFPSGLSLYWLRVSSSRNQVLIYLIRGDCGFPLRSVHHRGLPPLSLFVFLLYLNEVDGHESGLPMMSGRSDFNRTDSGPLLCLHFQLNLGIDCGSSPARGSFVLNRAQSLPSVNFRGQLTRLDCGLSSMVFLQNFDWLNCHSSLLGLLDFYFGIQCRFSSRPIFSILRVQCGLPPGFEVKGLRLYSRLSSLSITLLRNVVMNGDWVQSGLPYCTGIERIWL